MYLEDSFLKYFIYMLFNVIIRSVFIVLCLKVVSSIDFYFFLYIFLVIFLFWNFFLIGGNFLDIYFI